MKLRLSWDEGSSVRGGRLGQCVVQMEFRRLVVLYLNRTKPAATTHGDGTAQPALERSVAGTARGRDPGLLMRHPQALTEVLGAVSSTPRHAAREVPQTALTSMQARGAAVGHGMQSRSPPGSGTRPPLVPLPTPTSSRKKKWCQAERDRRTRIGGSYMLLPWSCGRDAGHSEVRVRERTTDPGGLSDTRVCVVPGSTVLAFTVKFSAACRRRAQKTDVAGQLGSPQLALGGSGDRLRDRLVEPSLSTSARAIPLGGG